MKRQIIAAVAAGTMMLSVAGAASADQGGVPNCNAAFGQATSHAASNGFNPNDRANRFNTSVQDIQQGTKAQADAGLLLCPV